jgi:hypothetical protein
MTFNQIIEETIKTALSNFVQEEIDKETTEKAVSAYLETATGFNVFGKIKLKWRNGKLIPSNLWTALALIGIDVFKEPTDIMELETYDGTKYGMFRGDLYLILNKPIEYITFNTTITR